MLLSAARTLGGTLHHRYLTETEVIVELTHAAKRAGLPDQEIAATVRDGVDYGKADPLPWPDKLTRPDRNGQHATTMATDSPAESAWPPLRIGKPPRAPVFPVDVFPVPLRAFCKEAARALLVPTDFVGGTMLATAGAAVGQSVNVTIKRGWTEGVATLSHSRGAFG